MKHRWAALLLVLALGAWWPGTAAGQGPIPPPPARERSPIELGQNYPNPFNPSTTIPFTLGDPPTCSDDGRVYRVTLRVYNVLAQIVAEPVVVGDHTSAGQLVVNLPLRCGAYTALWNGTYMNTNRDVASGVYLYRLEVDGRAVVKKMIVRR